MSVRSSIRLWFCLAVAVVSAALADPLIEWASNSGAFGRGDFTDHSNLDVLPALTIGVFFVLTHLVLRVRRALAYPPEHDLLLASREALRGGVSRLLPGIFAIQLLALFAMETSEQFVVAGHALGGTVWLGGPVLFSLAAHALTCVAVAFALSAALLACARGTVRAIRTIRAMATRPAHGRPPIELLLPDGCSAHLAPFVLRSVGERAPPLQTA